MAINFDTYRKRAKQLDDEEKKKRDKEAQQRKSGSTTVKNTVTAPTVSTIKNTVSGPSKLKDERDIAPVMKSFTPKATVTGPVKETEKTSTGKIIKKPEVYDGKNKAFDVAATILGTGTDLTLNALSGAGNYLEGIGDAVAHTVADIADSKGKSDFAGKVREKAKESTVQKILGAPMEAYEKWSASGELTDSVAQGVGMVGTTILGSKLLGAAGLGGKTLSAVNTTATALSGFGSGVSEAYEGGATDKEAKVYGMISGASEALTEMLFGGLGKGVKVLGLGKGLSSADDMLAKKVAGMFKNQIVKNFAEYGIKASAEGFEEVLAGLAQGVGKKLTYMSEKELGEIIKDEKLFEQFFTGTLTSGIFQGGDLITANAGKTDFITGLTENEQKVVDKVVENRIAEAEKDGKKLTNKDKNKIFDEVVKALDEGDIDTDTIESVLGGETYKTYKDTADNEAALQKEFDTLNKMKQGDMTGEQTDRRAELKEQLEEIKNSSKASQLKSQLSNEVSSLVKDSRLAESYNEKARRKEAFKADLTKYDAKQRGTVKKAIESGILNNTRRTHGFVDMIAKISADKGVSFDFTSNEKLKESGFAIEGKTVNGIVTKDGIKINVNSAKALNSVVGHEITHILEGTELYSELQTMLKAVAESKGEYQSRYDEISKLYEGIEGANIEQELTADLVGDYLFTDREFIRRLSVENRNVFQKLYDEIKYLCRVATAGSKEAKELEKVKKTFEEIYRESKVEKNTAEVVKYSVTSKMTEEERYTELKSKQIEITVDTDTLNHSEEISSLDNLEKKIKSQAEKIIYPLAEKLGITTKELTHDNIDVEFIFSKTNGLKESLSKQLRYGGNYTDFAKALVNLEKILDNAVLIEVHGDKYKGTSRENENLEAVYVLLGAFKDESHIIPVQMEIKKSSDVGGRLYMTVALTKIEADVLGSTPENIQTRSLISASTYSLSDIVQKINPKDAHFLKYIPDKMLSTEQIQAKKVALAEDAEKIKKYRWEKIDKDYLKAIKKGDTETAQKMVDEVARKNGYTRRMFHETDAKNIHIFDTSLGTHGATDSETPYGIFTKSSAKNIGLGSRQMALYVKADNTLYVEDRADVKNKIPEMIPYFDEISRIDKEYEALAEETEDAEFDALMEWMNENPDVDMDVVYPNSYIINNQPADIDSQEYLDAFNEHHRIMEEWKSEYDGTAVKCKKFLTSYLRSNGYDSMYFKIDGGSRGRQTDSLILLDSNQVKSADAVTYDDNGNVIPLSKRFNTEKKDIRYSLSSKDTTPKKHGDYAVYGEDVMLEGEAQPTGKREFAAPTRESIAEGKKKAITGAPMRADVKKKFPMLDEGDSLPIRKDVNSLKTKGTETEQILGESQLRTAEPKKNNIRAAWKSFLRNFVSKGAEVETYALKGKNRAVEDKYRMWKDRSEAKAQYFMEKGDGTGKSLKDIYDTVTQSGLEKEFDLYMKHRLNVDRMKYEKPVFSYDISSEMSAAQVKKLEIKHPEFMEWAKDVYAYNQNLLQMMVEKGLLLQETADMWAKQYPNYIPIERLVDKTYKITGKKIGISAPIKEATGGNNVMETLLKTMAHRTVQVFKAIDKNDFGIALKKSTYNNTLVEEVMKEDSMDDLSFLKDENTVKIDEGGKGAMFTVYENGKKVTFNISNEMYEALQPTRESLMLTIAPLNKTSAWHKKVLTEYNLFFTARNFPKDAQEVLLNSQHPVSTYANMPQALKEVISGKGIYINEYYKNGGRSNTYFDRSTNKFEVEKSKFKKAIGFVPSAISKINDVVEAVPRVAEYIASRKKGATIEAAMLDAARVTTDFSDGGDITKFLNRNGATFLNASVQGAAQQVRNIRKAKAEGFKGIMKLVMKYAVSGLPALLFNAILWDDDEEYEGLSEYIKESYYVIAKYGDGQFVRIPKGRTAAVIQKAVDQVYNLMISDDIQGGDILEAGKEIGKSFISNIAPNNPIDNNILAPVIQAATGTSWYGEDIVPARLQDVPAREQYDESVDTISKWLGENTGISPYKINYLLNQYSGFVGDMVLPAFTPEAENGNKSFIGNITAPMKDQFTADSVLKNNAPSDFYTLQDKLKVNSNSKKATAEDKLKYKYVSAVSSELSELYKVKREIQNSNLSDDTKFRQVREIQRQVNEIAKKAIETYENVNVEGKYATVNDLHYRLDDEGKWQKITDEQLEKQKKVTGILGITPSEYWSNKQENDMKALYPEKYAVLQKEGISVKDYKENYEESAFIYTDDYSWAADNPESYALSKAVTDNLTEYRKYTGDLYEIKADKDSNGKSISGSAKRKKTAYIRSLDIPDEAKYILYKKEYPSDDTYNGAIINYVLGRSDISSKDKKTILEELDFKIDDNGYITWD